MKLLIASHPSRLKYFLRPDQAQAQLLKELVGRFEISADYF